MDTALLTNTMSGACCNLGPAARDTQRRIFQPFPMRVHEAPSTMRQPKRGSIADPGLILVAAIWGINFSVLKVLLRDLEPLALNALRFPLASLALWTLVRRLPGSSRPKLGDIGRVLLLAAIGHLAYQLCFIVGLDWTFAGNASLLLATTPIWTVILSSAVGHERLTHTQILPGAKARVSARRTRLQCQRLKASTAIQIYRHGNCSGLLRPGHSVPHRRTHTQGAQGIHEASQCCKTDVRQTLSGMRLNDTQGVSPQKPECSTS